MFTLLMNDQPQNIDDFYIIPGFCTIPVCIGLYWIGLDWIGLD
jgi:hypothetical protein